MASSVKRSRTVAFSALRVLELLQQKDDSNDGENDLYRQLHYTSGGIEVRVEFNLYCVTVLV